MYFQYVNELIQHLYDMNNFYQCQLFFLAPHRGYDPRPSGLESDVLPIELVRYFYNVQYVNEQLFHHWNTFL